jgi:hypothetical protein
MNSILQNRKEIYSILLKIKENNNLENCKKGFNILIKLLENIKSNQNELKFRIIKSENKTIKNSLLNLNNINELIEKIGYLKDNENYVLVSNNFDMLEITLGALHQFLDEIDSKLYVKNMSEKLDNNVDIKKEKERILQKKNEEKKIKENINRLIEEDKKERKEKFKYVSDSK